MKYIVIFKAKINVLDDEYSRTAELLREKPLHNSIAKNLKQSLKMTLRLHCHIGTL